MYQDYPSQENNALAQQLMNDFHSMKLPEETPPWKESLSGKCKHCEQLESSHSNMPKHPEGGSVNDYSHLCPHCGRRWWQFNSHHHLWKHITHPGEWDGIRRNQIMINGGFGIPGGDQ